LRKAVVSVNSFLPVNHDFASACGKRCGSLSAKAMSMPMMAVTGAERVFSTLPGDMQASSRCFAAFEVTKTMRAGDELADVGPHFISS
jgi:hypothetical protein